MSGGFVHLHTHSHYSLLDGAASPETLVHRAAALGMTALALTDHCAMFGVVRFYRAARQAGVHPVIGLELAMGADGHHLTLLAENDTGYRNLCRLSTAAMAEPVSGHVAAVHGIVPGAAVHGLVAAETAGGVARGGPGRPVDHQLLWDAGDGLIVLTGCRRGRIPALLAAGRYDEAKQVAVEFRERFGRNGFFIELQDHGLVGQQQLNRMLVRLADELELGIVATNNVHYAERADAAVHDALLALGSGAKLADGRRPRFGSSEFYLKSAEEMRVLFGQRPEALTNTVRIADRCRVQLRLGRLRLPALDSLPMGGADSNAATVLADRVLTGARARFGPHLSAAVTERLKHELDVISRAGLSEYFLLVADIVQCARELDIPVGPGRGSAASSLAAYCLHITDVDPVAHELVFERFLNPERMQMPDIDVDVCDTRRDQLLAAVRERYGADRVAQIATFGTLAARAALRDMGRVLEVPADTVNGLVRLIPNEPNITLAEAQERVASLGRARANDARVERLLELAEAVEGTPRHLSVHAAGIVIGDGPLALELPLVHTAEGVHVTQYPMDDVEALGFLKMDILGLRTLTVIDAAKQLVAADGGVVPQPLPVDDAAVYDAINKFGTEGIFQLETPMFQRLVQRLRPARFSDIVALLALGRPGPVERVDDFIRRRNGQEPVRYHHPMLEPILAETYGIVVYQEQVMRIAVELAGYSPGEADLFRRAMSAKQADVLAAERERFANGATAKGVPARVAERIWGELVTFGGYGFAKSHSVAYALLCYETAYLRTHFPAPYFAALLSSWRGHHQRIARYVAAARRLGVRVLPPDVNTSPVDFRVVNDAVAFGLEGIRHVGRGAAEAIVAARRDGPFTSFVDFCRRVPGRHGHRRLLQSLIEAGACDGFGASRAQMLQSVGGIGGEAHAAHGGGTRVAAAQTSLFEAPRPGRGPDGRPGLTDAEHVSSDISVTIDTKDVRDALIIELAEDAAPYFDVLRRWLEAHPGPVPVWLRLPVQRGSVTIRVDDGLSVTVTRPLMDKLEQGIARGWLTRVTIGP